MMLKIRNPSDPERPEGPFDKVQADLFSLLSRGYIYVKLE